MVMAHAAPAAHASQAACHHDTGAARKRRVPRGARRSPLPGSTHQGGCTRGSRYIDGLCAPVRPLLHFELDLLAFAQAAEALHLDASLQGTSHNGKCAIRETIEVLRTGQRALGVSGAPPTDVKPTDPWLDGDLPK